MIRNMSDQELTERIADMGGFERLEDDDEGYDDDDDKEDENDESRQK